VAEQLNDYLEAGADGFVVDLGHNRPGLEGRIAGFAAEVKPDLINHRPAPTG
jgi:hypothetical protein